MRWKGLAASAAVVVLALTGCAPAEGGGGGGGGLSLPSDKGIEATIRYAFWDTTQKDGIEASVKKFNEVYPNIKVELEVVSWADYWVKLQTEGASKTLPDVFWMTNANFPLYRLNGMLEDLQPLVDSGDLKRDDYVQVAYDKYVADDHLWGVPRDFDVALMWYNKAIFDRVGLDYPEVGWTWDEFTADADAISAALSSEGIYGFAGDYNGGQNLYYNTIYQLGGKVISDDGTRSGYDDPTTIKGIQVWADLVKSGGMAPADAIAQSSLLEMFGSGNAGMQLMGAWAATVYRGMAAAEDLSTVPLPVLGPNPGSMSNGNANVISAFSANKQAAAAFVQFLATPDAARLLAEAGVSCPAVKGLQEVYADAFPGYNLRESFVEHIDAAAPIPGSKNSAAWNELEIQLLTPAIQGKVPVEEAAKELATKMNDLLAKE